ncbi:fasciclin domain-containing protein [Nakamurella sp. GG22]
MMMKRALTLVAGAALALTLAACGSNSTTASSSTSAAGSAASSEAMTSEAMTSGAMTSDATESGDMSSEAMESGAMSSDAMSSGEMAAPALVGAGCADYAKAVPTGAGSVDGMAQDPVATAASNNPILTTLTAAVSGKVNKDVDLVTTLNNGEFTVFAPVDDAFKKIDAATMTKLTTDAKLLSGILTYHVVPGQLSPTDVVGTHATANGAELTVTGSGDNLEVNGAKVICGGVKTKNATVYLIDTVLSPPAS